MGNPKAGCVKGKNSFIPMSHCDNAFCSSGFDLMEVGRDEVTLRTGKQANKRNIQFAHQALLALFGKLAAELNIYKTIP